MTKPITTLFLLTAFTAPAIADSPATTPAQSLADRQTALHDATVILQQKIASSIHTNASPDMLQALRAMREAAAALYSASNGSALAPQTESLQSLDSAIAQMEEQLRCANIRLEDQDLSQLIRDYQDLHKNQQAVNSSSDQVDANRRTAADHEFTRTDLIRLTGLSMNQGLLISRLHTLAADSRLTQFQILAWANQQVAEQMTASQSFLSTQQTGPQLAFGQQSALDRLQLIIDTLEEQKSRVEDEFKSPKPPAPESLPGGGRPPILPPVAEAKLLRGLQTLLNAETAATSKNLSNSDPANQAALLHQTEILATKQGEIRTLADKLIQNLATVPPDANKAPPVAP